MSECMQHVVIGDTVLAALASMSTSTHYAANHGSSTCVDASLGPAWACGGTEHRAAHSERLTARSRADLALFGGVVSERLLSASVRNRWAEPKLPTRLREPAVSTALVRRRDKLPALDKALDFVETGLLGIT